VDGGQRVPCEGGTQLPRESERDWPLVGGKVSHMQQAVQARSKITRRIVAE